MRIWYYEIPFCIVTFNGLRPIWHIAIDFVFAIFVSSSQHIYLIETYALRTINNKLLEEFFYSIFFFNFQTLRNI